MCPRCNSSDTVRSRFVDHVYCENYHADAHIANEVLVVSYRQCPINKKMMRIREFYKCLKCGMEWDMTHG